MNSYNKKTMGHYIELALVWKSLIKYCQAKFKAL